VGSGDHRVKKGSSCTNKLGLAKAVDVVCVP
jgi:hypothetical protein